MATNTEVRNTQPVHISQVVEKIIKDADPNRLQELATMKAYNQKVNIKIGRLIWNQRNALLKGDHDYAQVLERDMDELAEQRYIIEDE